MKINILTYGSRGDVQPFLALALGLREAGHSVQLAGPHRFEDFVSSYHIPFVPLAGDPEVISERLNDAGANPLRMMRAMGAYIFSIADQVARQAFNASRDADLIVHSFVFTVGAHSLARRLDIPDVSVQTFPVFAPTCELPPVALSGIPLGWPAYLVHWLFTQAFWHGGNRGYRRLQRGDPEAFDLELYWPFRRDGSRRMTPLLLACSPVVIPRPEDWRSRHIHISGYLFLETSNAYTPPDELVEFLAAEVEPPVCVTFGSMINQETERIYRSVLEALERSGMRSVLLSGWSKLTDVRWPDNVLVLETVPHDWLFPRCQVVVHHGGAGTTAAGLRAGVPNLVVPFAADQPFWGGRVFALGAGPKPIPVRKLTADRLVSALTAAQGESVRLVSREVGGRIREEAGVTRAVEIIEAHAREWEKRP